MNYNIISSKMRLAAKCSAKTIMEKESVHHRGTNQEDVIPSLHSRNFLYTFQC